MTRGRAPPSSTTARSSTRRRVRTMRSRDASSGSAVCHGRSRPSPAALTQPVHLRGCHPRPLPPRARRPVHGPALPSPPTLPSSRSGCTPLPRSRGVRTRGAGRTMPRARLTTARASPLPMASALSFPHPWRKASRTSAFSEASLLFSRLLLLEGGAGSDACKFRMCSLVPSKMVHVSEDAKAVHPATPAACATLDRVTMGSTLDSTCCGGRLWGLDGGGRCNACYTSIIMEAHA